MEAVQESNTVAAEGWTALRHTTVYGLANILSKTVGVLMLPLYTPYLTPSDYGVIEILDLSMTLCGMFLNMGITIAILRRYTATEDGQEKNKVISTALICVAITGLAIFALGLAFAAPISTLLLGRQVPV